MPSIVPYLLYAGLLLMTAGCGRTVVETASKSPTVFIDQKSKEMFVAPAGTTAAPVNPKTGQPTLAPALYCPQCKQWHAVPPLEVLLRQPAARNCVKTKAPLVADGPIPETAAKLTAVP